jgi:hypothetical protein
LVDNVPPAEILPRMKQPKQSRWPIARVESQTDFAG